MKSTRKSWKPAAPDLVEKLQVPERPSLEEAKDAVMAMRAVVINKVVLPRSYGPVVRFNTYVDGKLEEALLDSARVNAKHFPVCVDDPHLLVLSERPLLKRV